MRGKLPGYTAVCASCFLFGPPGTGKTHLSFGLYRKAVQESVIKHLSYPDSHEVSITTSVWRISANTLLQEHIDYDTRDKNDQNCKIPVPTVTKRAIEKAAKLGLKSSLFLDELDKIKATDYKLSLLCDIVNAIYEAKGQIVATSNKSLAQLAAKWGSDEAETVVRRIGGDDGGHVVRFAD